MSESRVIRLEGTQQPPRELVGGKAWSISRMLGLGLRVPPAFVLPVSECSRYHEAGKVLDEELWAGVLDGIAYLESISGKRFGDPEAPLLVSVRSGAAVSMPGMMDTVLNLGVTAEVEEGMARYTGNATYAHDTHARFCHQYGEIVLKADLDTYDSLVAVATIREEVRNITGREVPTEPLEQLRGAICSVFDSWDSARARAYRRHWGLNSVGGTAVTVQAMVFGNLGDRSGTGVLFTRNPLSGEPIQYGEWLPGGQGDDVVGGTHAVQDMITLQTAMPDVHAQLMNWAATLEREHREVQDIEFTVQEGQLYLLQTRTAKRAPLASLRIAVDLVDEGVITSDEAIMRVSPEQIRMVLLPRLDPTLLDMHIVASGEPACPGVAVGIGVMDPDEAERRSAAGESVILVRPTTSPNDVHGMIAAVAVVTELGGSTSHAAVVTRALGRPSVVGVGDGVAKGLEGKILTVDGESGHVYEGEMPLVDSRLEDDPRLVKIHAWVDEHCPITVIKDPSDVEVEVFDLDKAGFGMGHEGEKLDEQELVDALAGVTAVCGSVLGTALGMKIVLGSEVTHIVANPALPIKMLAVHVERDL